MIKILLDNYIFEKTPYGGIARYFREIIPRITALHPDISFDIICNPENLSAYPQGQNITYHFTPKVLRPNLLFWRLNEYRNQKYPTKIISKIKPDIFHSTYYQTLPKKNLKSIVTIYDFIDLCWPALSTNGKTFVEQQSHAIKNADKLVCISEATQADLYRFFPDIDKSKSQVIYLGVNDKFRTAEKEAQNDYIKSRTQGKSYFMFVGERASYKNFTNLLAAFAEIAEETNTYLVVVGGSPRLSEMQIEMIISNNIQDRVILTGKLSDKELLQIYHHASAFVYPSLKEGFGLPVLEAMASGSPLVVSDIEVFREIVGDAALFVDPHKPDDIAIKLQEVLEPEIAKSLREKGKRRVALFSWDNAAETMAEIYKALK